MSLMTVWISPARALVSVDTWSANPDGGAAGESSKMVLVPHTNIVIAVNGGIQILASLFLWMANNCQDDTSIDGVAEWLPLQLNEGGIKSNFSQHGLMIATVGFSRRLNRFRAFRFFSDETGDFTSKEVRPEAPYFLSPGDPWTAESLPAPESVEACLAIARIQVRWARGAHPGLPIGRRLLVSELVPQGARIFEAGIID